MNSVPGKVLDAISSSSTSLKRTLVARTPPFRAIFDQSYAKLLQFQLNFGKKLIFIFSKILAFQEQQSPSESAATELPNEYRNLLLSLSGNHCDHILWIRALRRLNWRGDGDFSFCLDKSGVPMLKVGKF